MKEEKILILGGHIMSLPFISHFSKTYETYYADYYKFNPVFFSKFLNKNILLPKPELKSCVEKIEFKKEIEIRSKIKKLARISSKIISLDDKLTYFLLKQQSIKKYYPKLKSFLMLFQKDNLYSFLSTKKLKTFLIPSIFENKVEFPCIIKPTIGSGGELFYICKNKKELKKYISLYKVLKRKPIVQKFVKGEKFTINLLINKNFKIVRALVRKVINEKKLEKIIEELEEIFSEIKYFGFASPQFIVNKNKIWLIEINPRLSFLPFGIDFNLDFPSAFEESIINSEDINKKIVILKFFPENFSFYLNKYLKEYKDYLIFLFFFDYMKNTIIKAKRSEIL